MRKLFNDELDRISTDEFKAAPKVRIVFVLDNLRSLNNIGSIFRTADAFRLEGICLCGISGIPPNKEIHKTALGATESVQWQYFEQTEDCVDALRKEGYLIVALEQVANSVKLNHFNIDKNRAYAIILGNEVEGVKQEVVDVSDYCVEIPQFGTKHSFNVVVSAGIVLWHFYLEGLRVDNPDPLV
ncbi:MAG: TrmH family RNA methyltransferase [Bacteroidetes bacterium]|nr:TrmH family RNA methyltransferase [Bacteroidota bacterium]MBU1717516.1 TrmH family RNA methyltransferase [Bacteroidota bacterium]